MSKWFRVTWFGRNGIQPRARRAAVHLRKSAIRAAAVGAFVCAGATAPIALGDDIQPASYDENSVLVAIRDATASGANAAKPASNDDADTLEPTSEIAERSPDLAETETKAGGWQSRVAQLQKQQSKSQKQEPQPQKQATAVADVSPKAQAKEDASQFGAALADVVRSHETKPAKLLGRSQDGPSAARELIACEPAKFQGIQPGKSTREELLAAWGKPAESTSTSEGTVLTFEIEPFQAVEVLIAPDAKVEALKITFTSGLDAKQLAKQLALEEFAAVTITDENARPLGEAFPERGVSFMFDPSNTHAAANAESAHHTVLQVAIQSLDARAFALRAENQLHGPYTNNISDLKTAISLDPNFAHARWLLAEVYLATGQADLALAESTAALDLEPTNSAYQLRHGQALVLLGQYDDAVHEIRTVLDQADTSPVVRAQALHEMARLASIGDAEIAAKAISFDTRAIELADKLATSSDAKERRAAKRVLIDAHLAIAEEIARQSFGDKVDSLQQWIGRASGLAEDCIKNENGSLELRLLVAQRALAALASFKPTLDPAPWVAEAEEAATALKKQSDDELWQQEIAWELGQAYLHALRTEHLRRETTSALRYGQLAIENMAEGAKPRQAVHSAEQLVGQLYFHVGAVYALHQQDHKKAVAWYDKAAPLLNSKRPTSELYSPRRDGEMLVSMGVSYWQTGNQAKALELTQAGSKLVEAAVEDGILAKSSLAVPYGNLATMYQQVGENANAQKYANLAKAVTMNDAKQAPRTGRSTTPAAPNGRTGMVQTSGQQQAGVQQPNGGQPQTASRPAATTRR